MVQGMGSTLNPGTAFMKPCKMEEPLLSAVFSSFVLPCLYCDPHSS